MFRATLGNQAADGLEKLTHDMCYLFGRATKAVSICPPAYYADILCTRHRAYMSDVFEASEDQSVTSGGVQTAMGRRVVDRLQNSMYFV